jgi:hypothetical protein
MILVVTDELTLRFILQHQGKFIQNARTATDALRILRQATGNLEGVILDDRLPNSRLVSVYVRMNAPGVMLVPWRVAVRHSPFSMLPREDALAVGNTHSAEPVRYVWGPGKQLR